jgi:TIMELESS-interacting protein
MKRFEHWAHRLYPKLPFDDVMNRISQLGKKKNVQVPPKNAIATKACTTKI